jgi:hypothetical protein
MTTAVEIVHTTVAAVRAASDDPLRLRDAMRVGQSVPSVIRWVRPLRKYAGPVARAAEPARPGGTPARVAT